MLRVGSWNTGPLMGKFIELVKIIKKWVGSKVRDVDKFKLWYSKGSRDRNKVGVLVRRINYRIMTIKLVIGGINLNDISTYFFWEDLDEVVRGIPNTEKIFIGRDFNGCIRSTSTSFD
ncbi:hypothetical protein R3W88_024535 [Solanum pinnatisectum]|uniref:Craniofacial development protein 2-like n=1 Tax=Solanum pinnatisectum TaxID=50273 RepID=A0AAV9M4D4_9SOLN|nr:hypothetical protein R3W88_024535 [Solanum pinnatisectum]